MPQKSGSALPSIQVLFSESWTTFKGSVLNLFLLDLVSFGIIIGLSILGVIAALPLGVLPIISAIQTGKLSPAAIASFGTLGILIAILFIIFTLLSYAIHAAGILFVGKYTAKPAFGKTFKASFKFILPLFLLGIVSGFIVAGGYFLFVIPGIFFGILFSFAPYEIVLNNQGVLASLRRSAKIVSSHFWGILGRLLLWIIIVMIAAFLPGILSGRNSAAGAGMSGLSFFVNIFLGWFGICYSLTLYKQASRGLEKEKGTKLMWPVVVSVIGWVVGVMLILAVATTAMLALSTMAAKQAEKEKQNQIYQLQQQAPTSSVIQRTGTPSAR